MSRILIAVTPLAGHVNPMLAVAGSLSQQGHDVIFNTAGLFRERVESSGLRFLPLLGNANYNYHRLGEIIPELRAAESVIDQMNRYLKYMFGDRIPDQYRGLRQIIDEQSVDLVMTDIGFMGNLPLLLRGEARPPVISCGVTAPGWHDPAFSVFAGPANTPEGRTRNIEHNLRASDELAPGNTYVDSVLEKFDVAIPGGYGVNTRYRLPDLFLQLGAAEFEYPMYDRPANLRFTGPILHKQKSGSQIPEWLTDLDRSKPLVFITQGTLANFDFNQLVNPALAGLAKEDVQLVVTAGGGMLETIVAPPGAIVQQYIPYEVILPKTSIFITNGGYNGVQQALSYGVPVVSAGVSEDKGRVCDRVNWSGTGIGLKTGTPGAEQIRDAVRRILHDTSYRERAQTLAASISKTDTLTAIAELAAAMNKGAVHEQVGETRTA